MDYPSRIVCLTEETTEALYAMGEDHRIVGVSGFTVRPPRARKEKPKVSAFTSAKIDRILALRPDLVLGFSDMQADIAAALIRAGVEVHIFNQRTVAGIESMMTTLAALIGQPEKGRQLIASLREAREPIQRETRQWKQRPRVYFEEWGDPLISGIGWVSELIGMAGGDDIFPEKAREPGAKERIIADPDEVVARAPDIIIGSWCGRRFRPESVAERPGWSRVPAVKNGHVYEVKSPLILQPGPASLTDGLQGLYDCTRRWYREQIHV